MKALWLDNTLIQGPYVALVINEKQFNAAMRHCSIPRAERGNWIANEHSSATVHTLEKPDGKMCCIVALRVQKGIGPNSIVGLLVHEAVHVWQRFVERIGEDHPSKEFEAYSIQSISQTLIQAYSDLTKKRAKK